MAAKIKITETEQELMRLAAAQLIEQLDTSENGITSVKQCAFEHLSSTDSFYQIQVKVTRAEHEFIDAFTTEVIKSF